MLDLEVDDYVRCTNCGCVTLVRVGQDDCPRCGEECLVEEPKPDNPAQFVVSDDTFTPKEK